MFREYPTGWMVSTAERNWKFRVSIVYAKHEVNYSTLKNKIFNESLQYQSFSLQNNLCEFTTYNHKIKRTFC